MNTIRNFTKILFALVLTLVLLGVYQASPVVQAEGEPPVPVGIISAGQYHTKDGEIKNR